MTSVVAKEPFWTEIRLVKEELIHFRSGFPPVHSERVFANKTCTNFSLCSLQSPDYEVIDVSLQLHSPSVNHSWVSHVNYSQTRYDEESEYVFQCSMNKLGGCATYFFCWKGRLVCLGMV